MIPQICVSVRPRTHGEAVRLVEEAQEAGADLVEVRLDQIKSTANLAEMTRKGNIPKIATDRALNLGSQAERKRILLNASRNGFEYVDIELRNPQLKEIIEEMKSYGTKPIISFHDYEKTMKTKELESILKKEKASGAAIGKIVTTATRTEDNLELLRFTHVASANTKIVCFGMGELGKMSRLLCPFFGSVFTFASLKRGNETASGQMTIQEMRKAYELLKLM